MILKKGDRTTNVIFWQGFLQKQGFTRIVAHGHFDDATDEATRAFQKMCVLREDGIVGPMTIAQAKERGFAGFAASNEVPKTATGKLVLVSAGHTADVGQDRGVASGRYIEGVEAVHLRDHLAKVLRSKGVSVIEDGVDGQSDPLKKALVLARKADIAVEFHFNAAESPAATGIEVLSKPNHKRLAQELAKAIAVAAPMKLRGDQGWKADNSGQHHRLAFCEAGGLIVEVCFLTNPQDMEIYTDNFSRVVNGLADVLAAAA